MDTTETTSPDLVVLDAELPEDDDQSFGSEVAKTLLVSTAMSALVFGGAAVIAIAGPKVVAWATRKKNNVVVIEGESTVKDAPAEEN